MVPPGFLGLYQLTAQNLKLTSEKWNYLVAMTAGIQNVISSADIINICIINPMIIIILIKIMMTIVTTIIMIDTIAIVVITVLIFLI